MNEPTPNSSLPVDLSDPDTAWGWFCNLVMLCLDSGGETHAAQQQVASFLKCHYGIDIKENPNFVNCPPVALVQMTTPAIAYRCWQRGLKGVPPLYEVASREAAIDAYRLEHQGYAPDFIQAVEKSGWGGLGWVPMGDPQPCKID